MPIEKPSQSYVATLPQVVRVRDFAAGMDAVKAKGAAYLAKLGGQSNDDYHNYKSRGYVMPVVMPTSVALTGAIMRKDPVAKLPTKLNHLLDDADGSGKDLSLIAANACSELMLAGRHGFLADPTKNSVAIKAYTRESIIHDTPEYIVLRQHFFVTDPNDKFKQTMKVEFLELTFDDGGQYIQNIWREKKGSGKKFSITSTIEPKINGTRLDKLPFVFMNTKDATAKLTPPALLHLADVNLDQYRLSTDLRHGLHWTALPTMFLFGELVDDKGKQVQITVGAGSVNHIQDTDAKAELLEFTGAGLNAVDVAIKEDIETMASIGARMLQTSSAGVKAAETARIEQSGESATLSTIAQSVENAITNILQIIADWSGVTGEVSYELNKDFIDSSLTPQQLTSYLQAFQSGAISLDTFLHLLHKGELLPKGITPELEADRIIAGQDFKDE